ncbi:MAG: hypothetical protein ACK47J_06250, partial [Pseudanabaena sp.]
MITRQRRVIKHVLHQTGELYSGFQMSVYSFENKKSVPLRVLSFDFGVGTMKTAIFTRFWGNLKIFLCA